MKKALALILAAAMSVGMAVSTFAAKSDLLNDNQKDAMVDSTIVKDDDGDTIDTYANWNKEVDGDDTIILDLDDVISDTADYYANNVHGDFRDIFDGIVLDASVSSSRYAEIVSVDSTNRTVEVAFSNTTFDEKDVTIKVTVSPDSDDYKDFTLEYDVTVLQAQDGNYTRAKAIADFRDDDDVEINKNTYANIKEGAFDIMLEDSDRTLTVIAGDSKIIFDSSSDNLDQDVYVGNIKTAEGDDYVAIKADDSTATADFKLAVSRSFYNNYEDADLVVYDEDGKATDIKATLRGDYTVNFTAAMGTYYVSDADFDLSDINGGNNNNSTDDGNKDNPGMGSNDVVGVAVALAAMSLVAAGAVAFKKVK